MKNKRNHRKVCGYLGCLVILGTLVETELPTLINTTSVQTVETHNTAASPHINDLNSEGIIDIDFNTDSDNRVYFINKQPVRVNTSQKGWVVDLMYAQKKKDKKVKTRQE